MLLLLMTASFLPITCAFLLNPKGPIHQSYVVKCLQSTITTQYKHLKLAAKKNGVDNSVFLLTILTSTNMTSPGHDIQWKMIKSLNLVMDFNLEVLNDKRHEFVSKICQIGSECRGQYLEKWKSGFYLIIVDSVQSLFSKLTTMAKMENYHGNALFIIYFSTSLLDYKGIAHTLLDKLFEMNILHAVIIIPSSVTTLKYFAIDFHFGSGVECVKNPYIVEIDTCEKGTVKIGDRYYSQTNGKDFKNCTIKVLANQVEPFVVDDQSGFEIALLHDIGRRLNVTFDVSIDTADSWGTKSGDFWSNGLGKIQNSSVLGIGNFYSKAEHLNDFKFTTPHFQSYLVWVVPIASYVPKWRVLTIIFSLPLWVTCISFVILIAVCLYLAGNNERNEYKPYRKFGYDLTAAYQNVVVLAVHKHPKGNATRLVFVSAAIFGMLITSVYTSSLINYLTTPKREPQIDTWEEMLDAHLQIGGLPEFRDIFDGKSVRSKLTADRFQTIESLNDWLMKVSEDRDAATLYCYFCINYMIAQRNNTVTDDYGQPKIFVMKQRVFSYWVRMVSNRGFPFIHFLNNVVEDMIGAGLILKLTERYQGQMKRMVSVQEEKAFVQQLSIYHLEGAFTILIFGYVTGSVCFLGELLVTFVGKRMRNK